MKCSAELSSEIEYVWNKSNPCDAGACDDFLSLAKLNQAHMKTQVNFLNVSLHPPIDLLSSNHHTEGVCSSY